MTFQEYSKLLILAICVFVMVWSIFIAIDLVFNFSLYGIRMPVIALIIGITIAFLMIERPLYALAGTFIGLFCIFEEIVLILVKRV